MELGLPISPLCDRKNTAVSESQIGQFAHTHTHTHARARDSTMQRVS